jgi:hypothetical protein
MTKVLYCSRCLVDVHERRCVACGATGDDLFARDSRWFGADRHDRWDQRRCPDGADHEMVVTGYTRAFEQGPLEGGPYETRQCVRCGVSDLDVPIRNLAAAFAAAGLSVRWRDDGP